MRRAGIWFAATLTCACGSSTETGGTVGDSSASGSDVAADGEASVDTGAIDSSSALDGDVAAESADACGEVGVAPVPTTNGSCEPKGATGACGGCLPAFEYDCHQLTSATPVGKPALDGCVVQAVIDDVLVNEIFCCPENKCVLEPDGPGPTCRGVYGDTLAKDVRCPEGLAPPSGCVSGPAASPHEYCCPP